MGWLKEKYNKAYFLQRDDKGNKLPYGVYGVEYWEKGEMYPEGATVLKSIDLVESNILDIGFGRGETILYCLNNGTSHVTGVDFATPTVELTQFTLKDVPKTSYQLYCEDALSFIKNLPTVENFTHVLMMDAIEHIPRSEVEEMLSEIYLRLIPGGSIVIHTPFFPEDDDVMVTGGKDNCKDSSDDFSETKGMHINRYSSESLEKQLSQFGFVRFNDYVFLRPTGSIPIWKYDGPFKTEIFRLFGYKVR